MQTVQVTLPEGVKMSEQDVLTAIATRLYDNGKLNIRQAAQMAGFGLSDFIEELTAQSLQEKSVAAYHY